MVRMTCSLPSLSHFFSVCDSTCCVAVRLQLSSLVLLHAFTRLQNCSSSFKNEFCIGALSQCYPGDQEIKGTLHIQQRVEQPTVTYSDIS